MMPIWVFHGADDTTVYPYQSEVLVRALRRCGARVARFTLYPGVTMSAQGRVPTATPPVEVALRTAAALRPASVRSQGNGNTETLVASQSSGGTSAIQASGGAIGSSR